jgi:hypothetical protein
LIILPRQARDKHGKASAEGNGVFFQVMKRIDRTLWRVRDLSRIVSGEKTVFLSHLYIKTMILPRQARYKHRESTQNKERFLTRVRHAAPDEPALFVDQSIYPSDSDHVPTYSLQDFC